MPLEKKDEKVPETYRISLELYAEEVQQDELRQRMICTAASVFCGACLSSIGGSASSFSTGSSFSSAC